MNLSRVRRTFMSVPAQLTQAPDAPSVLAVPVVPVHIHGMWGSIFSHKGGRILFRWPENFRRRVCVWLCA